MSPSRNHPAPARREKGRERSLRAGAVLLGLLAGLAWLAPVPPYLGTALPEPPHPSISPELPPVSPAPAPFPPVGPEIPRDDAWLAERLASMADPHGVLADPAAHRLQVWVTRVEAGSATTPRRVIQHGYRVDREYFYPASAIKPFVAVAALRQLDRLRAQSGAPLALDTPLRLCLLEQRECSIAHDPYNRRGGLITIGTEMRKMLLVSSNVAFNRLFDLVGHERLNGDFAELGFASLRLRHRIGGGAAGGLGSPRVELHPKGHDPVVLERRVSALDLGPTPAPHSDIGVSHYDDEGKLWERPADFALKNYVSLSDLQKLLMSLVDPTLPGAVDLGLSDDDRRFVLRAMQEDPRDSDNPRYRGPQWNGDRFKPLLRGILRKLPRAALRYIDKSGRAYGFEVDNAFVEHGDRALFISAVVYANPDEIVNDDGYAYHVTGAFLEALAEKLGEELVPLR